ncbi:iron transporter [Telmatospirillum sp.]|uniref:iron transporter n=1 Tax=Telmatospirillum sp. TaxID=2079197 RepID=UPI00284A8C26|nr:iron transporter [Telmatospirillum sp.]MDR3435643.1 iron transporter [Telmatospirillum sp.]
MRTTRSLAFAAVALLALSAGARAEEEVKENPIGEAKVLNNMNIAAVYLPPIEMDPPGMDLPASQADIHLEADIHATEGNPNGFGAGEWIPYLTITYRLQNKDTGKVLSGSLMPMVAVDGPHYGVNLKMPGVGNYKLSLHIDPPSKQGFGRHTDHATGVGKWPQTFDVDYDFKYVPPKK